MKFRYIDRMTYVRHWFKWYWLIGQSMNPLLIVQPEEEKNEQ